MSTISESVSASASTKSSAGTSTTASVGGIWRRSRMTMAITRPSAASAASAIRKDRKPMARLLARTDLFGIAPPPFGFDYFAFAFGGLR